MHEALTVRVSQPSSLLFAKWDDDRAPLIPVVDEPGRAGAGVPLLEIPTSISLAVIYHSHLKRQKPSSTSWSTPFLVSSPLHHFIQYPGQIGVFGSYVAGQSAHFLNFIAKHTTSRPLQAEDKLARRQCDDHPNYSLFFLRSQSLQIKGDNQEPACSRCTEKGIECKRKSRIRFRHTLNPSLRPKRASRRDLKFAPDQTWLRTAKSFNFVDETQEVLNIYETNSLENESDNDKDWDRIAQQASSSERSTYHSHAALSQGSSLSQPDDLENGRLSRVEWVLSLCSSPGEELSAGSEITTCIPMQSPSTTNQGDRDGDATIHPSSPTHDANVGFQALLSASHLLDYSSISPDYIDTQAQAQDDSQWPSPTHIAQQTWPLKDKHEAQLFYHWVRNIAPLFDLCDHERHFATVVPQRAIACPPLLKAILASSAKHSSRMGLVDPLVADKYYQESLRTIIPVLSNHNMVRGENLLAAIVILRFIEEVDIPFSLAGPQSHLIGTRAFLAARDRTRKFSKLGRAIFWLALRQEIWVALIHSRSVHPDLLVEDFLSLEGPPECDCDYANRVIVQTALCLQYCFGEKEQQFPSWEELKDSLDRWYTERPWQFYPMSADEDEDQFLPERKYLTDAVVIGSQHYYLARLILEAHNPTTLRLGPARKMHLKNIDQEMRRIVRTICGIAKANPHTVPAYVSASVSIVLAGDRFTDKHEQDILYNILVKTGQELAWPTWSAKT
ncbi:hypothetical protein F5Y12DRAFT_714929 [Xylaria sp. FL1777]|nr:hypothetical protein F5Y12DRAFT_714929 [Xylaria sp. FL1777]